MNSRLWAGSHRLAPMRSSDQALEVLPLSCAAARRAGLGRLRHTVSTGSTNVDLAREARGGDRSAAVLVADHQTAGRGRLQRRWLDAAEAPGGAVPALLVSFRLRAAAAGAIDCSGAVSAAALQSVAGVLAGTDARVRAKWPNDLLIEAPNASGKLAGVLSEIVGGDPGVVVVGLGLNLSAAPSGLGAVSLAQAGAATTRDELLASMLDVLPGYLADPGRARAALEAESATIGRMVRVEHTDGTSVTGLARGLDDAGRLVVTVDGSDVPIDAGDVFHLR